MPIFEIIPTEASLPPMQLIAPDAGRVLEMVQRLHCQEAHVLRDGKYLLSVRLDANGLWCIQHHELGTLGGQTR